MKYREGEPEYKPNYMASVVDIARKMDRCESLRGPHKHVIKAWRDTTNKAGYHYSLFTDAILHKMRNLAEMDAMNYNGRHYDLACERSGLNAINAVLAGRKA